jgi:8-amino-7-oxononanoate synthase
VGNGPRSSALVAGFTTEHRQLELELAALKDTEDALLFPSGYAANVAVLTVLAGPTHQQQQQQQQMVVFSDELNHASIIDGARLAVRTSGSTGSTGSTAGAVQLMVYRHNDLVHLQQLLEGTPAAARKMVVTDSLFSMDGDFADLRVRQSVEAAVAFRQARQPGH